MSSMRTSSVRISSDHFQPEEASDPQAQRRLRGQLEQIDYTAYVSNREVIGHALGQIDVGTFQRLAVAAASARAKWVAESLAMTAGHAVPPPDQISRLAQMRANFEELSEAYEALRRMVERGYVSYGGPAQA